MCLYVYEVLGRIIEHLAPTDALRLALTSKGFLEPSLDRVWEEISSFKPLIACLPNDLWEEESVPFQGSSNHITILHLRRALRSEDIRRYITYYAPRIRAFSPDITPGMEIPSIDSLQALELVTERRPGALSPLLKEFRWYNAEVAIRVLGWAFAMQLSPRMHLFLGGHVEILDASNLPNPTENSILDEASVYLSIKSSQTKLRVLALSGANRIDDSLRSFSWNRLETVSLTSPSVAVIPRLASLPRLQTLRVFTFEAEREEVCPSASPRPFGFLALRHLSGHASGILGVQCLLQHLALNTPLQTFSWGLVGRRVLLAEVHRILNTVGERCDPHLLTSLKLWISGQLLKEEPLDVSLPDQIDLSPLFKFRNLSVLNLKVMHSVLVTPDIVARIPISWPRLQQLVLCPALSTSHTLLITHKHVLELALSLPCLSDLGVQFDATRVTEQEGKTEQRSKLRVLHVGRSPIRSPSQVIVFLKRNFPHLENLESTFSRREEGELLRRRWDAVVEGWKASRGGL